MEYSSTIKCVIVRLGFWETVVVSITIERQEKIRWCGYRRFAKDRGDERRCGGEFSDVVGIPKESEDS